MDGQRRMPPLRYEGWRRHRGPHAAQQGGVRVERRGGGVQGWHADPLDARVAGHSRRAQAEILPAVPTVQRFAVGGGEDRGEEAGDARRGCQGGCRGGGVRRGEALRHGAPPRGIREMGSRVGKNQV